jgi:uncharacterized protein (DUF58 family)
MQLNIFNRKSKETSEPLFDEQFLRRLERLNFRTAPRLRGNTLGEQRSRSLRPALDFSDHRAYTPGDDLRHIDWHIYGHHEKLFIKLGEASQSVNVHILLDCSHSMAWEPAGNSFGPTELAPAATPSGLARKRNKWNVSRRLAGALAYLALSGGERLNITTFADKLEHNFGPTQGKRRVITPLRFLTNLTPVTVAANNQPGISLARNLTSYARIHSEGGLLILISDLLDTIPDPALPASNKTYNGLAEGLRHLNPPHWQVLVMHLLTTAEMQPDITGDFDFEDIETRANLPFSIDQDTLAQYRLRAQGWCAGLEATCARQGTTYSRILAEWPLEQKVIPYLRQRGVVR